MPCLVRAQGALRAYSGLHRAPLTLPQGPWAHSVFDSGALAFVTLQEEGDAREPSAHGAAAYFQILRYSFVSKLLLTVEHWLAG